MQTAIFLTTRYGSTRLPGKALLEIDGQTVTDILIHRLKETKLRIIMCTPDTLQDTTIMREIAKRNGISYYAGDKENIIKRHHYCAIESGVDWIINIDGDDILICPETIKTVSMAIHLYRRSPAIYTNGLPLGLNVLAYNKRTLANVNGTDTNWGMLLKKGGRVIRRLKQFNDYRLTLDYPEDYEVIKDVLVNCRDNKSVVGICNYLDNHPEVAEINLWRNEEYFKRLKELSV